MAKNTIVKNEIPITPDVFAARYNKSLPKSFPQATAKALAKFQITYPRLFKNNDEWSIAKHRKRFMDWHSSQ